jgi:hypothetical protein
MAEFGKWTHYKDELPPRGYEEVLYCCWMDDYFTDVRVGWYEGKRTLGDAIAMESVAASEGVDRDWAPCTHWMPLPPKPEIPND